MFSPVLVFEPAGLEFELAATLTVPFDGDGEVASLFWSAFDGDGYDSLGGEVVDGVLTAEVEHFSTGFVANGITYENTPDANCMTSDVQQVYPANNTVNNSAAGVLFSVRDCKGRPVGGLSADDIKLTRNDIALTSEASVTRLSAAGTNLFVTLAIETGAATRPALDEVFAGAMKFIDRLEASGLPIHYSVARYAEFGNFQMIVESTLDVETARDGVAEALEDLAEPDDQTVLASGMYQALFKINNARAAFEERNKGAA